MTRKNQQLENLKRIRAQMGLRKKSSTAKKALKLAKKNKKFINKTIENKQVSANRPSTFVSTTGYSSNVAGDFINPTMKRGAEDGILTVGSNSRIGNSITLMRTGIDFCFDVAASTEPYNKFRLIVVESTEGAEVLALSDVLQFPAQPMSSQYTTKSLTNKRYHILLDKKFTVCTGNTGARFIKFKHKYSKDGRVINYDGNAVDPVDYKLTILAISDSSVAPHPTMEYTLRHSYKDA